MQKQTFYRKDVKQNIRVWSIEVEDRSVLDYSIIKIEAGILGGGMIKTDTPIEKGLGGKTHYEQAVADAQTEINKQIKKGYVKDITQVKESHESATIPKPMKGEKYWPTPKKGFKSLSDLKLLNKCVIVQPKLDGWRFRIAVDETGCIFYTSSGDVHPGFAHIEASLVESYRKLGLEETVYLDGEIYNHELGYNATASACGTTVHLTTEKIALQKQMQFHIFDVCSELRYEDRYKFIKGFISKVVVLVENFKIICTDSELKRLFSFFLSKGYEGLMIRTLDKPYEYKRCNQLTKWKPIIDAEFPVVGFEKSITGNTLGALVCITDDGQKFNTDLKGAVGTDAFKKKIWNNQSEYLGQFVTIEFLEYTPEGKPRNGKVKSFRKGISID